MVNYKIFVEGIEPSEIGIFPGAFKPPHKGHFLTAKTAAQANKNLIILISSSVRDGMTSEKSMKVWDIYKKYLPTSVSVKVVSSSPITTTYQIVDILNNGKFSITSKVLAPIPEAKEVADFILKQYNSFNINLYTGKEDAITKYNAFFSDKTSKIYKGKNVKNIISRDVNRLTSASSVRDALKGNNIELVKSYLPDISAEDKKTIVEILQS